MNNVKFYQKWGSVCEVMIRQMRKTKKVTMDGKSS